MSKKINLTTLNLAKELNVTWASNAIVLKTPKDQDIFTFIANKIGMIPADPSRIGYPDNGFSADQLVTLDKLTRQLVKHVKTKLTQP